MICVNLVDRTEPVTIIDMAEKQDVPVIFFNRELVEQDLERWDRLYYVGAPALQSGILQGEMAADLFQKDPSVDKNEDGVFQYVVLEGEMDHQDAIVRTEYAINTITEQGVSVEKLGYGIANWNRGQAQTKMTQMIGQYGEPLNWFWQIMMTWLWEQLMPIKQQKSIRKNGLLSSELMEQM